MESENQRVKFLDVGHGDSSIIYLNSGHSENENVVIVDIVGIIELVYIVLQSVVKPGITGFFKIDLHIKCYIYLS